MAGGRLSVVVLNRFPCEREALARELARGPDIDVVGHHATGADGVELVRTLQPDVVVVDLLQHESSPALQLAALRRAAPSARVLVWTDSDSMEGLLDVVLVQAADGYVSKRSGAEELRRSARLVGDGAGVVTPALAAYLLQRPSEKPQEMIGPEALSPREREVVALVASGCTDREIADQLGLSHRTVHHHLAHVRRKTGLRRRAELALWANPNGSIPGI